MTTPRIGDTVHYRARREEPHCVASVVTDVHGSGRISTATIHPGEPTLQHKTIVNYDTDGAWVDEDGDTYPHGHGFTPGTWHHIH